MRIRRLMLRVIPWEVVYVASLYKLDITKLAIWPKIVQWDILYNYTEDLDSLLIKLTT